MLVEYSFEHRPSRRALGTAGSVMAIDLSIKDACTRKTSLTREKTGAFHLTNIPV